MSETVVVRSILNYYAMFPNYVKLWRVNTGGATYSNKSGKKSFVKFGFPGMSDILGIRNDGKLIAIECKFGKNKTTEAQDKFADMIKSMNGIYILAYSLDDVIAVLKPEVL